MNANANARTPVFTVARQGRNWAVYRDGVLIEGGWCTYDAAKTARDYYARQTERRV